MSRRYKRRPVARDRFRLSPTGVHRLRPALLLAVAALSFTTAAGAQRRPDAEQSIARAKAALAPYAMLVGTWDGDARASVGRDRWVSVAQHEEVEWHSFGTVLLIRGTGRGTELANKGEVVFEALATIWYDAEQDKVRMRTHNDGGSVEPSLEVRPDTIVWGFPVQGGRVRYTIAVKDGTWHEVGEYLRDGGQPVRTVDMRLTRTMK
jgi:hypothetical protein